MVLVPHILKKIKKEKGVIAEKSNILLRVSLGLVLVGGSVVVTLINRLRSSWDGGS